MKKQLLLIIVLLFFLSGCNAAEKTPCTYESLDLHEDTLYTMLFNIENKITLNLDMTPETLAQLQADHEAYTAKGSRSPVYRMADLHITIETPDGTAYAYTIEQVGVRMKGNTSRTDFYSEEDGIYNLIHLKLSFQETFDQEEYYGSNALQWESDAREERKNRTFATLAKLDLRWNRCDDGTYLKEYFAYETYRAYGVPAPRTNLASFDWAGIHMGVFTINEPVDKIFLKKNFPKTALGGDLYKVGWAGNYNGNFLSTESIGIEDEGLSLFYAYDLKTNKKTSCHEALTSFIQRFQADDFQKEELSELVDMDTFLSYAAVSYLLGNPDDMRNNYNNYYVYFRADTGKAVFIPYDYDRCLGITAHWNPTHTGVTDDDPFTTRRLAVDRDDLFTNSTQQNPVILYSIADGGYYVQEYAQRIQEILDGSWFRYETFSSLYETARSHYDAMTTPEKEFHNARGLHLSFDIQRTSDFSANENLSIQDYLTAKMETAEKYLQNVDSYTIADPKIPRIWYIRSSFTQWEISEEYYLSAENGRYERHVSIAGTSALKLYNAVTGIWCGSECIAPDCTVSYTTDENTNIILSQGTYLIAIDPVTNQITLKKE